MVPNRVRLADRLGNSGAIRLFRAPLLAVLLIAACTPIAQSGPTPTATPLAIPSATSLTSSTPPPPPSPSPSATAPTRVFVAVMEHNPFAYYGGECPTNVVPLGALDADLAGNAPRFVWITPGLCHDGHDCALAEAAVWLDGMVSRIVASAAWREHGVLFVVWDEGDG